MRQTGQETATYERAARSTERPVADLNTCALPRPARDFLDRLLQRQFVDMSAVGQFLEQAGEAVAEYARPEWLGKALVEANLLTSYQLDRALAGTTHGMVLGNYRIKDRLGAGAMGVVFLAEHMLLKRSVAIKVLQVDDDCPPALWERFCAEMQVLASLQHPNIVLAFDAGQVAGAGPGMPPLLYLVMELVPGGDLDEYVDNQGPVDLPQACEWIRQAACGLQEAHDHHLIHRDIKPSNLLLTGQKQVKVMDFGLVRQFSSRRTCPRQLLGTLDYMAPEQCSDPSLADSRADIYGLGATLFYLLTGEPPYPPARSLSEAMRAIQSGKPRRLQNLQPEAPGELDAFIDRMLSLDPAKRPALPLDLVRELRPFTMPGPSKACAFEPKSVEAWGIGSVKKCERDSASAPWASPAPTALSHSSSPSVPASHPPARKRVLLVDDEPSIRRLAQITLERSGFVCAEAGDATTALTILRKERFDLILLDLNLPDMDGYEVCRRLRTTPDDRNLKIIVVSGRGDQNQLSEALPLGADDYIAKPFGERQLRARVEHALRLKEAQEQAEALARQLVVVNAQLESSLAARTHDVRQAEDALLFAMAKMAESKDGETSGHLRRLQRYCRCLAERVAEQPGWAGLVNSAFLEQLERCVPLHDIGKIGLPEHILLKPGKLTSAERALMETHTIIGDRILEAIGLEHGTSLPFLRLASAIVRHHHERYDGTGYPDRLAGDGIPAAARLVAVADVYDALRRQRSHKAALDHAAAAHILLKESPGQFDPAVLQAFQAGQGEFAAIYRDIRT
jgi:response regulator RpfG family c-di-GMP phosphodiesterase